MISFYNPEFHEKIMKKCGRIIRKSYFPNLFFKQDFRSSGQRKLNVFVRIKIDLHDILFLKNYLLNSSKEKTHGTSYSPLELKIFGSIPLKQVSEKNVSLSPVSGSDELKNLTYRFTLHESLSDDFIKYPELTVPGSMQFNFAPFRLINQKLIVSNLQPSNLRFLNPETSGFRDPNHFSASSTLPNLKSLKLNTLINILKLNFFKKSYLVLISRIRNRIQMLQNDENTFLKDVILFFTQSTRPASREISTQDSGFLTSPSVYLPIHFLGAYSFIRKDFNETLRKNEELKHSERNLSGRAALIGSSTGTKGSRNSEILLAFLSKYFNSLHLSESFNSTLLSRSFNSTSLSRSFNPERVEQKLKVRKKKIGSNQRKQHSGVKESKEEIWEKQQIITTKEKQNLIETKKKQYIREFNWLTAVKKGIEIKPIPKTILTLKLVKFQNYFNNQKSIDYSGSGVKRSNFEFWDPIIISQLNQQVPTIPGGKEAYQLNRKEKLNSGSEAAFQLNKKEEKRPKNAVFSPLFNILIRQTCTALNYEKIRSMFYIFRYLKTPKLTSELTRITRTLIADYQQFNPHTADSVIDYNFNFFDSRIADYTPDYRLSDPYTDFNYVPSGRKIDSNRLQNWKKHNPIQINRMKSRLDQHLFFKSPKITAHRLKWAKAISFNYEKNTFQKARFAAEFLTHSLIPVPAANSFPHKIHNKPFRKTGRVSLADEDFLFHESAPAKRSNTETTGLTTSEELLEPSSRAFNLLFNPYSLKRKTGISKEAVKSISRRKHSSADRSKLKILIKQALIERKAEKGHGETSVFRRIQNMSLIPSVQFLIQNFLEKTVLLLNYESLTNLEKPGMGQNLIYQQRKAAFPYSDKKIKKIPSTCERLSAKKTVTGKKIPVNFSKNLLIFQKMFLKEIVQGFLVPYIQQLTSKPITLIRSPLLAGNNEILRVGVSSHGAASKSGDHKNNRSMSHKMSMSHEISMCHKSSERSFFVGLTNAINQYPETISEVKPSIFEKTFVPSIVETNKNLQAVLKLSSYQNLGSKISENMVIRIFNCLTLLTRNLAHNLKYNKSTGFQQNEKQFQPDILKITPRARTNASLNWQQTLESESVFLNSDYHVDIKPASSQLFSRFKNLRPLLARNKPDHATGIFGANETYRNGLQANPVRERKVDSRFAWILKVFDFSKVPLSSSRTSVRGENPAYPQKISVLRGSSLREPDSVVTYIPEQPLIQLLSLNRDRIFKDSVVLKSSLIEKYIFNSSTVHTTGVKDIYSNLQQVFHAFNYTGTCTFSEINRRPEDRKSSSKEISTPNLPSTSNYLKNGYLLFDSDKTTHYSTKIARYSTETAQYLTKVVHYLTSNQKTEYTREKKREQEYSGPTTEIEKLQNKFIWFMFLKSLDTVIYRAIQLRKSKTLPSRKTQNIALSGTKTPIFGLREVNINSRQNHIIQNTSVHTETYPVTWTSNSPTNSKQSYPVFFKSLSVLPKKEALKYSRILDPASGMNTSAATENHSILNKIRNSILANSLSSNRFLSGTPLVSASVLSLSKTIGISSGKTYSVYNLLKYAYSLKYVPSTIFQNSVFAKKLAVLSNTETKSSNAESLMHKPALRYKPASVSQISRTQKPNGQKVSHGKTARMNLSPEGGKQRSANTGNFLQRRLLDSLKRKKNKLRVNKSIDIPAEVQIEQHFFLDIILSPKYDFINEMKKKKIISITYKSEKNLKNTQDAFNGFLFRSKIPRNSILKSSEKTASSRINIGSESTDFVFPRSGRADKPHEIMDFELSGRVNSELTYAGGSNRETERGDLVYGTSEPLLGEVKKIEKIVFETREAVADHLESHVSQVAGKPEQVMDVEYMSEKIMQVINRRLKIEAERRGIF